MPAALEQEFTGSVVEQYRDGQVPVAAPDVGVPSPDVLPCESPVVIACQEHLVGRRMVVPERHCG
jgi:hypothetical protein